MAISAHHYYDFVAMRAEYIASRIESGESRTLAEGNANNKLERTFSDEKLFEAHRVFDFFCEKTGPVGYGWTRLRLDSPADKWRSGILRFRKSTEAVVMADKRCCSQKE